MASIADTYYKLVASASRSLDIKVRSPWPAHGYDRPELREFMYPEHVLIRQARAGVKCRLICLDPESYRAFFSHAGSRMAETPYFEDAQAMIAAFESAGGCVRRVGGAPTAELSFVVADGERGALLLGAWGETKYGASDHETSDERLIQFLEAAFELCWSSK
jgi:hypothetical protein